MADIIKSILRGLVKSYQPKANSYLLIMLTVMLAIICLLFTLQTTMAVKNSYEIKVEYGGNEIKKCDANQNCELTIHITQHMQEPVFVYLELDNFYQSHKNFVTSIPIKQLGGRKYG